MKQVVQDLRKGDLRLDEVPAPTAAPGRVLVANHASLISVGTERSTVTVAKKSLAGKAAERPDLVRKVVNKAKKDGVMNTLQMVASRLDTPSALGYSCAGVVYDLGEGVTGLKIGDRVACAGQDFASHAEFVSVPRNLCVKIPEGVGFEPAAYVTLGAIALQGVRQAEPTLGSVIGVVGLGLLGQLTVQLLKANGCQVLASDLVEDKRQLALDLGADRAVAPGEMAEAALAMTEGHGVDAVILTASTKGDGPMALGAEIARRKGRVVVVGMVGMNLEREPFYRKELDLRLSTSYGPGRYDPDYEEKGHDYPYGYVRWTEQRNMQAFLELVGQSKIDVGRLTSHRFAIAEAERAYETIMDAEAQPLGVILNYAHEETEPGKPAVTVAVSKKTTTDGVARLGLIGVGNHVKDMLLPALKEIKSACISAVCSSRGVTAKHLAAKLESASCTTDPAALLADDIVDAVVIGTRHDSHGKLVLQALEAGKHVFVEKPLCLTWPELEAITAAQKARPELVLSVGFNRRFSAHMEKAKATFKARRDPLVMSYRVNAGAIAADHWIQDPAVGGGRIIGEACHFIDYLQCLAGAAITSVQAQAIGQHSSQITEDQAIVTLTFEDGSLGTVIYAAGGEAGLSKERCEVLGAGTALIMDDFSQSEIYAGGRREVFKTRRRDKGFAQEMTAFIDAVTGKGAAPMSFEEIDRVTRATFYAVDSMKSRKAFTL